MSAAAQPLFMLGSIASTPAAMDALHDRRLNAITLLLRHQRNDSDLDAGDLEANRQALIDGSRLFSAFDIGEGDRVFVITEAADDLGKRRFTTLLLDREY